MIFILNNSIILRFLVLIVFLLLIINLELIFLKNFLLFILLILYIGGIFLIIIYLSTLSLVIYKNIIYELRIFVLLVIWISFLNKRNYFNEKYSISLNFINLEYLFLLTIIIILLIFIFFLRVLFSNFKEPIRAFYTFNKNCHFLILCEENYFKFCKFNLFLWQKGLSLWSSYL